MLNYPFKRGSHLYPVPPINVVITDITLGECPVQAFSRLHVAFVPVSPGDLTVV